VLLTNVDVEITSNSPPQPSKNIQKWVHLPWIFLGNSGFRNPVDYLEKRGCHAKKCYSTKKHSPSLRINHKLIYIPWVLISFMFHLWHVCSSLYTVYVYIYTYIYICICVCLPCRFQQCLKPALDIFMGHRPQLSSSSTPISARYVFIHTVWSWIFILQLLIGSILKQLEIDWGT
jgi:hypothetical protein